MQMCSVWWSYPTIVILHCLLVLESTSSFLCKAITSSTLPWQHCWQLGCLLFACSRYSYTISCQSAYCMIEINSLLPLSTKTKNSQQINTPSSKTYRNILIIFYMKFDKPKVCIKFLVLFQTKAELCPKSQPEMLSIFLWKSLSHSWGERAEFSQMVCKMWSPLLIPDGR